MTDYKESIKNVRSFINLPFAFNHWYVAGQGEEFGQTPKAKTLLEKSVVFYRTEAGELTALQNRCLHRSFPLSEGYREGDLLVCRYHGMRYSPDGEIARIPCQKHVPDRKLQKVPVREVGPFVFIWMGDENHPEIENRFPDVSFLEDANCRTMSGSMPLKCNYLLMLENLNDLTHFAYLHRETFGFDDFFFDMEVEVKNSPEGVMCKHVDKDPDRAIAILPGPLQERLRGKPAERWESNLMTAPGICNGRGPIIVGDREGEDCERFERFIMHFLTPETKSTSHYFWSVSSNFCQDDDEYYSAIEAVAKAGFVEDKWACEHMQTLLETDRVEFDELTIAGDKAGMLFRRAMLNWVNEEYGGA